MTQYETRRRQRYHKGTTVALLMLATVVVVSGCIATTRSTSQKPLAPRRSALDLVIIMEKPRRIQEEEKHPNRTRQIFSWGRHGAEWRVLPTDKTNSYAGFSLRTGHDLAKHQKGTYLSFRLKPCVADNDLSFGLVSGAPERGVLTSVPLANHRVREWGGWGLFAIEIDQFPDRGWVLHPHEGAALKADINWKDIQGFRLTAGPREDWAEPIIIRDLQFGPPRPDMF